MPTKTQLDRIESAIIGNGHEGLLARTARIEEQQKVSAIAIEQAKIAADKAAEKAEETAIKALDSANTLSINVTRMNEALITHMGTDHLSVLIKKKSFWTLIIVGYIALHIVSTYVPSLWDWWMLFLGIPKLVIPLG
jgi:hypothetical protein